MRNLVFILALTVLSASAIGQKVNFSGEWTLNTDKSELGYEMSLAPKAMTLDHTKKIFDQTLSSEWDGMEYETRNHYTLDGAICENPGLEGTLTKSTAVYDKKAKTLKIVTDGEVQGMSYTLTQVFSMNEGNLVIESEATSDMGELAETFVYDKK